MKIKIFVILIVFSLVINNAIIPTGSNNLKIENIDFDDLIFNLKIRLLKKFTKSPSLAVCCIKGEDMIWSKFYGFSELYKLKRPDKDTIYPVGSVTKTFTTTAMLQLYEEGLYDLDEDINNYLPFSLRNPYYPNDPITFRMILSHRSCIYDYCIFTLGGIAYTLLTQSIPDDAETFIKENLIPGGKHYNKRYWKDYKPGTLVGYSNVGFLVVGYLFERIANKTIEEHCQEHIFKPLNMYNTSFNPNNLNKAQMATMYIKKAGIYIPIPCYNAGALTAVGGLKTTIEDLSHYLMAHMHNGIYKDNRILKNETIQIMHNCIYKDTSGNPIHHNFGLGWWKEYKFNRWIQGHGGMCPGGTCFMMMNETEDMGFILMTNQFNIMCFFQPIQFRIASKVRYLIGELLLQKTEEKT